MRQSRLEGLRDGAAELTLQRQAMFSSLGESCKRVFPNIDVHLMEEVGEVVNIEDVPTPRHVARGLPLVGHARESPHFIEKDKPARMSLEDLVNTAP